MATKITKAAVNAFHGSHSLTVDSKRKYPKIPYRIIFAIIFIITPPL
jgi:hypothetical protein